jgi:hypothetical protein
MICAQGQDWDQDGSQESPIEQDGTWAVPGELADVG